jgi:osmotically inducible protein OsmC
MTGILDASSTTVKRETPMKTIYTAVATASSREGRAVASDSRLDVQLASPKEMGGSGAGTNPEQLFAAAFAACFADALHLVARRMTVDISDAAVTAEVVLGRLQDDKLGLAVTLRVELPAEFQGTIGTMLIDAAREICPYSNAVRGNIDVRVVIE